jgi:5-methylcytosine-specific restriction endonuclease McrA
MPTQEYLDYIDSPEWREKADRAKKRAGYRCQVCNKPGSETTLDAHHRTYVRFGNEQDDDITVLCRACHDLFENKKKAVANKPKKKKKNKGAVKFKEKPTRYEQPKQILSQKKWRNRQRQVTWDE